MKSSILQTVVAICLTSLFFACEPPPPQEVPVVPKKQLAYELVKKDGIFAEKFDSKEKDQNRYNYNNNIFEIGNEYTYDYYHLDKNGKKQLWESTKGENYRADWKFVPYKADHPRAITQVSFTVIEGLEPFIKYTPDYNQTIVKISYLNHEGKPKLREEIGLIENEKNLWMHPPRTKFFSILEINPFPFIQAPYEVGTKFEWSLEVSETWGDKRWKTWSGTINNKQTYEITGKEKVKTGVGELDCFKVEAKANSSIGESGLVSYFHPDYGFVKLDYSNIDGSKTVLELKKKGRAKLEKKKK